MALGYRRCSRERQKCSLGQILAPGARGIAERPSHIVASLIAKRRELAGVIAELERQLAQHRADLTHIDGVLRVLATDLDPECIKPKRVYLFIGAFDTSRETTFRGYALLLSGSPLSR
jgi:hypothetical protein